MSQKRLGRINEEVQKEISSLLRTVKDPRVHDVMISVVHVDTSSDLKTAKLFISVYPSEKGKEVMQGLKSASGYLRRELGSALQLRYTPELHFVLDDSMEYGAHILDLLHHVKPANPANESIVLDEEK